MRRSRKHNTLAWAMVLGLSLTVACTKKRDDQLAQGQGIDAMTVESVKDWKHSLKTGNAKFTPNKSVAEKDLTVAEDLSETINNFPLVEYTTDSEWLGTEVPLRGRPNFTYEIRYELGDSLMRVLKVGLKKDIPSEEWPFAVTLEDGKLGVPLVGYSLSYFKIDKAQNEDRKKTSTLIEIAVADRLDASHLRINRQSRNIFEAVQKVDIYPADYFRGDWYYQATVVQTQIGNEDKISSGAFDTKLNGAEKVSIKLDNRKTLVGTNANVDARIEEDNSLDHGYVFSIPIEWKEFEAAKSGRGQGLNETAVDRQVETRRPYIKINFEEHFSPADAMGASAAGWLVSQATGAQKLVDVKMAKDYFSFTLLKSGSGLKVRYSFIRNLNSTYSDVRSYDERDFKTFGYFFSVPNLVLTRDFQKDEDFERLIKMNRFNPKVREIVYHFSKESPRDNQRGAWVRELGRYSVHFWDQAFQKAGTNIRVRLDESMDVDLGDLRYNVIHIVDPLNYNPLGGFGPSIADPNTGEIISATTNVVLSMITEPMAGGIRSYIRSQVGEKYLRIRDYGKSSDISSEKMGINYGEILPLRMDHEGKLKPMWLSAPGQNGVEKVEITFNSEQEALIQQFLNVKEKGARKVSELNSAAKMEIYDRMINDKGFGLRAATVSSPRKRFSQGVSAVMNQRIKKECPAVDQFIAKVDAQKGEYESAEEVEVVETCTLKLARLPILHTLLHEMGHNFSLTHNFKCSSDPGKNRENLWTANEIRKEFTGLNGKPFPEEFLVGENAVGSCVMDYVDDDEAVLPVPGKYDIAAIRFIYNGEVETASGSIKPVYKNVDGKKQWMTIREAVGTGQGKLRPLSFCSDWDANLSLDPMCERFDTGETPEQAVDYLISDFWNNLSNTTYSYERFDAQKLVMAPFGRARNLSQLKRFYDEWRLHLSKYVGVGKGYLESIPLEDYSKTLDGMSKSPAFKEQFLAYKPARDKILSFFTQLVFMSDRYCLGQTAAGNLKAMELSNVVKQVSFFQHDGAIRCSDKASQDVLKHNGITLIKEFGSSVDSIYFSNAPQALEKVPDVMGTLMDRILGLEFMTMRAAANKVNASQGLFPSMLDEPDVRQRMIALLGNRITSGVNVKPYLQGIPGADKMTAEQTTLRMFSAESGLLEYAATQLPMALAIPGKLTESRSIMNQFTVGYAKNPTEVEAVQKQGAAVLAMPGGAGLYAFQSQPIAYGVISRSNALNGEIQMHTVGLNVEEYNKAFEKIASWFPVAGKAMNMKDAFELVTQLVGLVDGEGVSPSIKAVTYPLAMGYIQFLQKFNEGKMVPIYQKWMELKGQVDGIKNGAPTVDSAQKLSEAETMLKGLEDQLIAFDVARFLGQSGLPVDQSQVAEMAKNQLVSTQRLFDADINELRAQQDLLTKAVTSWAQ